MAKAADCHAWRRVCAIDTALHNAVGALVGAKPEDVLKLFPWQEPSDKRKHRLPDPTPAQSAIMAGLFPAKKGS
jgi:hypothetical protein